MHYTSKIQKRQNVPLSKSNTSDGYIERFLHFFFIAQIIVTFAIVFGVVLYRISIKTALHMSSTPTFRSNVRATVKSTAAVINLIIIIIMDEIYGALARWLTTLGGYLNFGQSKLYLDPGNVNSREMSTTN